MYPERLKSLARKVFVGLVAGGLAASCAAPKIPTISDARLEMLVADEARRILAVTENNKLSRYQIHLSDFPRKDILGMSIGKGRIYVSYDLARLASGYVRYRWLLRQTLAHEIAHDIAGHAEQKGEGTFYARSLSNRGVAATDIGLPWYTRFRHYSRDKELEADLKGMQYWKRLHWDCRIWVRIFASFQQRNYSGDIYHPTPERLRQAVRFCLPEADPERIAIEIRLAAGSARRDHSFNR